MEVADAAAELAAPRIELAFEASEEAAPDPEAVAASLLRLAMAEDTLWSMEEAADDTSEPTEPVADEARDPRDDVREARSDVAPPRAEERRDSPPPRMDDRTCALVTPAAMTEVAMMEKRMLRLVGWLFGFYEKVGEW